MQTAGALHGIETEGKQENELSLCFPIYLGFPLPCLAAVFDSNMFQVHQAWRRKKHKKYKMEDLSKI